MSEFPRLPPSGIKVIIVGAGFGGLTAAIECDRKGHEVILLEKFPEVKPLGDAIGFGQNSSRIFTKWPGVWDKVKEKSYNNDEIHMHNWEGKYVTSQAWIGEELSWGTPINGHRAVVHGIVFDHLKARGIDVRLGEHVTDYFEDDHEAGVISNGKRLTADVVVSAEGVKSTGRKIVLGVEDKPKSSGYAIYRTVFPASRLEGNPALKRLLGGKGVADTHNVWIGKDAHLLAFVMRNENVVWLCTHKDSADIDESWQYPGKIADALKVVEGWSPEVVELVKATPEDRLIDYKLVFRDPLPTFISPKSRIALLGDAAHPFLPTSIQGASQSMEDGATLAVALELAGKANVTEGLKVYEKLRYERVHKVQRTGVTTREGWHEADWDAIWKNPELLHLPREKWILDFDAEEYAYAEYENARASL